MKNCRRLSELSEKLAVEVLLRNQIAVHLVTLPPIQVMSWCVMCNFIISLLNQTNILKPYYL